MEAIDYPNVAGTKEEQKKFSEVFSHYDLARDDLARRIQRKDGGFDDSDRLYFGKLKDDWPFQTKIFDHQVRPLINRKTARLIGAKPKGRFVPREGSDEVGAFVLNELYNYQWEDMSRIGLPMVIRWALMDQQTRRYGASFLVNKWHYEERDGKVWFDGPDSQVIYARDALPNPSYSEVKNWFQYREWMTLQDLKNANDISKSKTVWKNLDLLSAAISNEPRFERGQRREAEYMIKGKSLRSLQDVLGKDKAFRVVEIIHELRNDEWVSFAPKYGVVIRDIKNPYIHKEIPVVQLKYDPNMDDIYGVGEIEVAAPHQRALNALLCADIDAIVQDLYPPLHINPAGVRMHTIEWKPGAKWLMNRPGQDVVRVPTTTPGVTEFVDAYSLLQASLNNSLGETTAAFSQLQPLSTEKTASEIRETTQARNVYDNFNQIVLSEALKKQAYHIMELNRQYLFNNPKDRFKVIRVVGREAVNYFRQVGMDQFTDEGPKYPVSLPNGQTGTKFMLGVSGQEGDLFLTREDIQGTFDFIPDVESMQVASEQQVEAKLTAALQLLTNKTIIDEMASEGKKPRITELIIKLLESTRVLKGAEQFFANLSPGEEAKTQNGQTIQGGTRAGGAGGQTGGNDLAGGMAAPQGAPVGGPEEQLARPQGNQVAGGSFGNVP